MLPQLLKKAPWVLGLRNRLHIISLSRRLGSLPEPIRRQPRVVRATCRRRLSTTALRLLTVLLTLVELKCRVPRSLWSILMKLMMRLMCPRMFLVLMQGWPIWVTVRSKMRLCTGPLRHTAQSIGVLQFASSPLAMTRTSGRLVGPPNDPCILRLWALSSRSLVIPGWLIMLVVPSSQMILDYLGGRRSLSVIPHPVYALWLTVMRNVPQRSGLMPLWKRPVINLVIRLMWLLVSRNVRTLIV